MLHVWLVLLACTSELSDGAPTAATSTSRLDLSGAISLPGGARLSVVTADLDHSGHPDLVSLSVLGLNTYLGVVADIDLGGVDQAIAEGVQAQDAALDDPFALGDVNGDGWTDAIVVAHRQVYLFRGQEDGIRLVGEDLGLDITEFLGPIAVGDVNGDGADDLALGVVDVHGSSTHIWFGGPGRPDSATDIVIFNAWAPELVDLDGDGDDDLVNATLGEVEVQEAQDGLLLPPIPLAAVGWPVRTYAVPDVDGDGDDELAVRFGTDLSPGGGHLDVWLGAPGLALQPPVTLPDPVGVGGLSAADADNDGYTDLVVVAGETLLMFAGSANGFLPRQTRRLATPDQPGLQPLVSTCPGGVVVQYGDTIDAEVQWIPMLPADADLDGDGFPCAIDPDDTRADAWPGAAEIPANGVDEDGDGWDLCGRDDDRDGFGSGPVPAIGGCDSSSLVPDLTVTDCDDQHFATNPGAVDRPGLTIDLNCDGMVRCWQDLDLDGYGGHDLTLPGDADCDDPGEASEGQLDCDDADPTIHPGTTSHIGEGFDADCDGRVNCFVDVDGDGARSSRWHASHAVLCDKHGEALATAPYDCDDEDARVFTGAEEVAADGKDQNCDGGDLCFDEAGGRVRSADLDCDDEGESRVPTTAPSGCATTQGGLYAGLLAVILRRRR